MCLTIPARVVSTSNGAAVVMDRDGLCREVSAPFLRGLEEGDWVLHINGLAIRKLSPTDAAEILDLLEGRAAGATGRGAIEPSRLDPRFREAVERIQGGAREKADLVRLLGSEGMEKEALFSEAGTMRKAFLRDFICVHGIIEFSNHCLKDCLYCGIRRKNRGRERFRMSPGEIVDTAVNAVLQRGFKLLVLQSGEDPFYTDEVLADIIQRIKARARVFIFISMGERGYESYRALKEAGASGALLRFETSERDLFRRLHPRDDGPSKDLHNRLKTLAFLRELGYYIATGSLTGLPGQTLEVMAEDILVTEKWADMVSTGPFVPSPATPLASYPAPDPDLHLKAISVLRLVMRRARIPVVTAYETLAGRDARKRALACGANSIMINLTPRKYRGLYELYPRGGLDKDSDDVFTRYGLFRYEGSFAMLEEDMLGESSRQRGE